MTMRPRSARRLLAPLLVVLAVIAATFSVRIAVAHLTAPATAATPSAFPTSPAIEQAWGIRFTAVNLLADNGVIEVRYVVLDESKAARLHSGKLTDLPVIRSETTGMTINSSSLIFHIHTDNPNGDVGHDYNLLYGNANGAVHPGSLLTIQLPDGLRLQHVPAPR
jgi:hypothetical protein